MKSSRTLKLRTEALTELSYAEAALVAGASGTTCFTITRTGPCCSDLVECVPASIVDGACELPTLRGC